MTPFVEQDCTIEHDGRKYSAGGAVVTPDYAVGYIGKPIGDGMGCDRNGVTSRRELTDWHGNRIGYAFIHKTWRIHSHWSSTMHQVDCVIDGITYTGRSMGEGMIWRGKRKAKQE